MAQIDKCALCEIEIILSRFQARNKRLGSNVFCSRQHASIYRKRLHGNECFGCRSLKFPKQNCLSCKATHQKKWIERNPERAKMLLRKARIKHFYKNVYRHEGLCKTAFLIYQLKLKVRTHEQNKNNDK